jgi:hypothetical protein
LKNSSVATIEKRSISSNHDRRKPGAPSFRFKNNHYENTFISKLINDDVSDFLLFDADPKDHQSQEKEAKLNVAFIVHKIHEELGIDFHVETDIDSLCESFLEPQDIENLRGKLLYNKLLGKCLEMAMDSCKDQISKYKSIDDELNRFRSDNNNIGIFSKQNGLSSEELDYNKVLKVIKNDYRKLSFVKRQMKSVKEQEKSIRLEILQKAIHEKESMKQINNVRNELAKKKNKIWQHRQILNEKEQKLMRQEQELQAAKEKLNDRVSNNDDYLSNQISEKVGASTIYLNEQAMGEREKFLNQKEKDLKEKKRNLLAQNFDEVSPRDYEDVEVSRDRRLVKHLSDFTSHDPQYLVGHNADFDQGYEESSGVHRGTKASGPNRQLFSTMTQDSRPRINRRQKILHGRNDETAFSRSPTNNSSYNPSESAKKKPKIAAEYIIGGEKISPSHKKLSGLNLTRQGTGAPQTDRPTSSKDKLESYHSSSGPELLLGKSETPKKPTGDSKHRLKRRISHDKSADSMGNDSLSNSSPNILDFNIPNIFDEEAVKDLGDGWIQQEEDENIIISLKNEEVELSQNNKSKLKEDIILEESLQESEATTQQGNPENISRTQTPNNELSISTQKPNPNHRTEEI